MNKVREKLRNGGTVMVFNPNFPSPALVEHAGELGFDVAFIDCEHGSAGFERAEELARAARAVYHRVLPSRVSSMQSGPPGALMVSSTFRAFMSMIEIVFAARLETSSRVLSPIGRKLCAPRPVTILPAGLNPIRSISAT